MIETNKIALEPQEVSGLAVNLLSEQHLLFSRIEAKSSVILGVDTGMIWYLATKLPPTKTWDIHCWRRYCSLP